METNRALTLLGAKDVHVTLHEMPQIDDASVLIAVKYGGICGSDINYYEHGKGSFSVVQEPLVLGHELSGVVKKIGTNVTNVEVGQPVAINPSWPCSECTDCLLGNPQVCSYVEYLGSAARIPHTQGGLTQYLAVRAENAVALPKNVSLAVGALAEPLAVATHAVNRAGNVAGKRAFISGAGPIGLLTAVVLKEYGAREVVISDVRESSLAVATRLNISKTVNISTDDGKGVIAKNAESFDVAFEASGSRLGLKDCIGVIARLGTIVQVGMPPMGDTPVDLGTLISREINYLASLRFSFEFTEAVRILGQVNGLEELIYETYDIAQADEAFSVAQGPDTAGKILFKF